jgi:hypothetical protein
MKINDEKLYEYIVNGQADPAVRTAIERDPDLYKRYIDLLTFHADSILLKKTTPEDESKQTAARVSNVSNGPIERILDSLNLAKAKANETAAFRNDQPDLSAGALFRIRITNLLELFLPDGTIADPVAIDPALIPLSGAGNSQFYLLQNTHYDSKEKLRSAKIQTGFQVTDNGLRISILASSLPQGYAASLRSVEQGRELEIIELDSENTFLTEYEGEFFQIVLLDENSHEVFQFEFAIER